MAYNVKFLKGASAEYSVLENKDMNTFYYVDNKDLYLGTIKLSNGEDLAAAILRVAENETDIANLQRDIAGLTGGEGNNGTISTMISDAINALRTELKADYEAKIKVNTDAVAQNAKDIDAIEADYLKAADKAELAASIKAIADDYLVEADKTELSGKIAGNTAAINTLNGDDTVEGSVAKEVKEHFQAASKWDRMSLNIPTQGGGAIVLKEASIRLFNWIVDNNYFNKILLVNLTHDEIN